MDDQHAMPMDDDAVIQELIAMHQLPVMPKLQLLLRSICSRLTIQASRIEKAEEQGKTAASLKDEFDQLSKKAMEEKEREQEMLSKSMEERIKRLDDLAKQYSEMVAGLQGADLSVLQSLPSRLAALEEKASGSEKGDDNDDPDQQSGRMSMKERIESLQVNFTDQNDKLKMLEEQIRELKMKMQDTAKAHSSDIDSLQKICRNLRSDIEMIPILDISAPHESSHEPAVMESELGVALSELQNRLQRKADHESVDQLVRATAQAKEGIDRMQAAFDELKQQVRSFIPGASRRASSVDSQSTQIATKPDSKRNSFSFLLEQNDVVTKDVKSIDRALVDGRIKSLEGEIATLAARLAGKADRKDLDGLQIQMALLGNEQSNNLSSEVASIPDGVLMETSSGQEIHEEKKEVKKHKDDQEEKAQLHEQVEQSPPHQEIQGEKQSTPLASAREFQNMKSSNMALQRLQELISKKADRDELLQLHEAIQRQRTENPPVPVGSFENENFQQQHKSLLLEIENLNDKMKKLEERSDLNVLISKRLENFAQPAATIQESQQGLDDIKAAINEHADRMMEYADTLLQMEALMATKADASGLQALRDSILELKKRRLKERSLQVPPAADSLPVSRQIDHPIAGGEVSAAERVEKHEMLLSKLLKDMELLGAGILTLSGHTHTGIQGSELQQKASVVAEKEMGNQEGSPASSLATNQENKQSVTFDNTAIFSRGEETQIRSSDDTARVPHVTQNQDIKIFNHSGNELQAERVRSNSSHDTLNKLEEALHDNLIKPKGDADVVNKLAEDMLPLSLKMKEINDAIRCLQDNTAEKDELQKMKAYLKQRLDRAETAMLSGRGLPGFKCMSCAHRLEKLNPNRAEFLPTNCMPRQLLPMHAAERLYHKDGEVPSESPRQPLSANTPIFENQNKSMTNSKQILSPHSGDSSLLSKPKPAKKK